MEVMYYDLAHPPITSEQKSASFEGTKSGYLRGLQRDGNRLLRQEELADGGYQVDSLGQLYDGTPAYLRVRIYLHGTRTYLLTCATWHPDGLDETIANRFFGSLHFMDALPTRPGEVNRANQRKRGTNRKMHAY
jgi:hypothetical protein